MNKIASRHDVVISGQRVAILQRSLVPEWASSTGNREYSEVFNTVLDMDDITARAKRKAWTTLSFEGMGCWHTPTASFIWFCKSESKMENEAER